MLWCYFFTTPSRQPLEAAAKDLARLGYRVVGILKKQSTFAEAHRL